MDLIGEGQRVLVPGTDIEIWYDDWVCAEMMDGGLVEVSVHLAVDGAEGTARASCTSDDSGSECTRPTLNVGGRSIDVIWDGGQRFYVFL